MNIHYRNGEHTVRLTKFEKRTLNNAAEIYAASVVMEADCVKDGVRIICDALRHAAQDSVPESADEDVPVGEVPG